MCLGVIGLIYNVFPNFKEKYSMMILFPILWFLGYLGSYILVKLKNRKYDLKNNDIPGIRFLDKYQNAGKVLIWGGVAYISILIIRILYSFLNPPIFHTSTGETHISSLNFHIDIPFLIVSLIAAFAEELFFRGLLLEPLFSHPKAKSQHIPYFVFAQALIFALFHFTRFQNIGNLIIIGIFAIYFGLLYLFTQNLWIPIIFHIINNLLAILYESIKFEPVI